MKTYEGRRITGGVVVIVTEIGVPIRAQQLRHHRLHSPGGFEWGYGGSGPAELARCILIDHFGGDETAMKRADEVYQEFKWKCIAVQPYAGFKIDTAHINEVLQNINRDREHAATGEQPAVVEFVQ